MLHNEEKARLQRFLECRDAAEASRLLEKLLKQVVEPCVKAHLSRRWLNPADREEVVVWATWLVTATLEKYRNQNKQIDYSEAFIRKLTNRALGDFLARKYPERENLKERLRSLFKRDARLNKWLGAQGALCGLATWETVQEEPFNTRWMRLKDDPENVARNEVELTTAQCAQESVLVCALLEWVSQPVPFEGLVTTVARIQHLDASPEPEQDPPFGESKSPLDLHCLWKEIGRLETRQRAALLLDMRNSAVNHPLDLLVSVRVANHEQIAAALEMDWLPFFELWRELPLADKDIATRLGTTDGNVRFLRFQARTLLTERMVNCR